MSLQSITFASSFAELGKRTIRLSHISAAPFLARVQRRRSSPDA
jgi:hypothetical protein